jgi:hypothetical protein
VIIVILPVPPLRKPGAVQHYVKPAEWSTKTVVSPLRSTRALASYLEMRLLRRIRRGRHALSLRSARRSQGKGNIAMVQINNWLEKFRRWPLICSVL